MPPKELIGGYILQSYWTPFDILPALKTVDSCVLQARELCYQQG